MQGVAGGLRVGYARGVQRDEVIAALGAHEAEFRQAGVVALSVFGSVARDDAVDGMDREAFVSHEHVLSPCCMRC
jgi:predicted nucleotidyltransferase